MPTYEYRCPEGHQFELFQKMSEKPVASCPSCGADSERLLSGGAGFLFKGDGFYITESRSESYKNEASKESSDSAIASASDKDGGSKATSAPESGKPEKSSSTSSPAKEGP